MGGYGIFRNGTEEGVASRFSSHPSKNLPFQLAFFHSHHSRVIVMYLLNKVSKSTKLIVTNPMYRKTLLPFLEKYFYMRGLQIGYEVVIIIVGQVHYKTFSGYPRNNYLLLYKYSLFKGGYKKVACQASFKGVFLKFSNFYVAKIYFH